VCAVLGQEEDARSQAEKGGKGGRGPGRKVLGGDLIIFRSGWIKGLWEYQWVGQGEDNTGL
jgi:hypothetical protein